MFDEDNSGALFASLSGVEANQIHEMNASLGNNRVEVEDANGCISEQMIEVIPPETEAIAINENQIQPASSCDSNGFIDLTNAISGGVPPYEVFLNNELVYTGPPEGMGILGGLGRGIYNVKVIDQVGCVYIKNFDLLNAGPGELTFYDVSSQDPFCYGSADGSISFDVLGGNSFCSTQTPPSCDPNIYWYKINDGPFELYDRNTTSQVHISDLPEGEYTITVMDGDACEIVYNLNLLDPEEVLISNVEFLTPVVCSGGDGWWLFILQGRNWRADRYW